MLAITGSASVDSPLYPPCRPSYQWTHSAQANVIHHHVGSASVGSPLYSSCLYHHHWISISGLTTLLELPLPPSLDQHLWINHCQPSLDQHQWTHSTKANNSINITGSAPMDSPLYSSCLYHHVGHYWISVSGLTALLELPLPPSLDQHQWTHRCLYHVSHYWISISGLTTILELPLTTMLAITGSASVDSPLCSS